MRLYLGRESFGIIIVSQIKPNEWTLLSGVVGLGGSGGCWWVAATRRGHLPRNRPKRPAAAVGGTTRSGGGMERDDGAFGAVPVPMGGAW